MVFYIYIQRLEISDRYVLCGETYTQIRESLTKVILGEDVQHLEETLQVCLSCCLNGVCNSIKFYQSASLVKYDNCLF